MKDINPPIELVRQWAAAAAGSNNPSKYMRECYLQYGYEQGARVALAVPVAADSDVIRALIKAGAALADISNAERKPGDDLAWCERRAAKALPFVRDILAAIMPDDALDPDSLVGRMLRPATEESSAAEKPLPLWQVMYRAYDESYPAEIGRSWEDTDGYAAEIEALRDYLPDMPPQELITQWEEEEGFTFSEVVRRAMDWVRALLTEQARIARGEHD